MEIMEYTVNSEMEGMRIDRFLKKNFSEEPLSKIFQALRKGDVKVDGRKVKENYRLSLNEKITVKYLKVKENIIEDEKRGTKISESVKRKYREMIVHENEDFFIVNKKGNIPMHKGTGHDFGLSEVFKEIYNNKNINFANRLDYETSGLVIGCKTLKFLRYISEKIRNNEVEKRYIAVVHGKVSEKEFVLENYLTIGKAGVEVSETKKGKESRKSISRISAVDIKAMYGDKYGLSGNTEITDDMTVLNVNLITGRKHQIRAQLSDFGYPILGDRKYGIRDRSSKLYLCCYFLSFDRFRYEIEKNIFK